MKSATRQECEEAVLIFLAHIFQDHKKTKREVLYIGLAGDPNTKGEYSAFLPKNYTVTSLDADEKWKPDIVYDATKFANSELFFEQFDLIIMTQVIEHIPNIFDLSESLSWALKPNGYLIVDCPWNYPYHAEPPSFGDFWRITKDGFKYLFQNHFNIIQIIEGKNNTSCLMKKK